MCEALVCGAYLNRNGPEEFCWRVVIDTDGRGISHALQLTDTTLRVVDGALTFHGQCKAATVWRAPSASLPLEGSFSWSGLVYHDSTGGPGGDTPRGSFTARVTPVATTPAKVVAFVGNVASATEFGSYHALVVAFDETSQPLSHTGTFTKIDNSLVIVERIHPLTVSGRTVVRQYHGKWVKTTESHKFCGIMTTTIGEVTDDTGSFCFTATEMESSV